MNDIVDRIRNRVHDAPMPTERLLDEAADEIEHLREELQSAQAQVTIARKSNGFQLLDALNQQQRNNDAASE